MELQEDELVWAHQIKARVSSNPNLDNLTDYKYAEWAIATLARQDMDEVLERIYKMQCFLQEYKISKSTSMSYVENGVNVIRAFTKLCPSYLLSIDYMPSHGHYLLALDLSALKPSNIEMERDWRNFLGGYYFIFQLMNSNLVAVRQGIACMIECMDMGFHNFSQTHCERVSTDLCEYYPMKQKEGIWLNTPTAANIFLSFLRPFLPDELKKSIRLGCQLPGYEEKIDTLFLTPSPEAATAALLVKIEQYLTERQNNELIFKLPLLPSQDASP